MAPPHEYKLLRLVISLLIDHVLSGKEVVLLSSTGTTLLLQISRAVVKYRSSIQNCILNSRHSLWDLLLSTVHHILPIIQLPPEYSFLSWPLIQNPLYCQQSLYWLLVISIFMWTILMMQKLPNFLTLLNPWASSSMWMYPPMSLATPLIW